jgi:hypothetical protein
MYQTLVRQISGNIRLWNVDAKRKHKIQIKGIWKEGIKKNLRTHQRKRWHVAIKSNDELNRLIGNKNNINYIKAQRFAWFGHVHRMPDNSMVEKYMNGHPH